VGLAGHVQPEGEEIIQLGAKKPSRMVSVEELKTLWCRRLLDADVPKHCRQT
jgi:hypothetical protein